MTGVSVPGGEATVTSAFDETEHVHSDLKRVDAERLIRNSIKDGTFLIRRKNEHDFVISVWVQSSQMIEHHRVVMKGYPGGNGQAYSLNNNFMARDCMLLLEVVEHLRIHKEDMSTKLSPDLTHHITFESSDDAGTVEQVEGLSVYDGLGRRHAEKLIRYDTHR